MSKQTILYVEDELSLAEIVKESLEAKGFCVIHADQGLAAFEAYKHNKPDLIVLDVMLPDTDGFQLAKSIRAEDRKTPIIFLTSKSLPQNVVDGFESGGNDYLKKPFSLEELIVRIRALLSNDRMIYADKTADNDVEIGNYKFHYHRCILSYREKPIQLTAREAEILKLLLINKNQIMERDVLLKTIWGNTDFFTGRSLDVFITKLRKYLKQDPAVRIINIRGVGYKLIF